MTFTPAPIVIYCSIPSEERPGELYTFRVATTFDVDNVAKLIADDRKDARKTFGGLIEPGQRHERTYRVFRAEWTEITEAVAA